MWVTSSFSLHSITTYHQLSTTFTLLLVVLTKLRVVHSSKSKADFIFEREWLISLFLDNPPARSVIAIRHHKQQHDIVQTKRELDYFSTSTKFQHKVLSPLDISTSKALSLSLFLTQA